MTTTPTQQPAPDYDEPWKLHTDFAYDITANGALAASFEELDKANRAVSCVNACAGMADPAAEIQAMRDELADIRQRLKGHPDSKLDGEKGLAAATMRGFDGFQVENEAMRTAIKEAHDALDNCVEFINDAHIIEAQWQWEPVKQARAALTKLQSFLP